MDISVVIVTTNSAQHIGNCLRSIAEHTSGVKYEVIVADNGSTDGTVECIKNDYPWVTLVENGANLGFGTANNRGAAKATGDLLFILNDDTILTENSLKKVVEKMRSDSSIGVLGYHLTNPDGSHQDSVRRYPFFWDQFIILTKLHNLFPHLRPIKRYLAQDIDYGREQEVDQVMGACMVMPRTVFEHANGFDERFFVWFEEVDLQKRIKEQQDLRIVYSPVTEMIHVKGATFGRILSLTNQRRFNKSMRQYFFKHYGFFPTCFLVAAQPWSLALAWVVQILKKIGVGIDKYKYAQG